MAVPPLPANLAAGDVLPESWVDDTRDLLEFLRDGRPAFAGFGWDGVGSPANSLGSSTSSTGFGFGNAGAFAQITGQPTNPNVNVGGWTVNAASANPEPLVVPETGIYRYSLTVEFATGATAGGHRQAFLRVNGGTDARPGRVAAAPHDTDERINGTGLVSLTSGDLLEIRVNQTSGSSQIVIPWLSIEWIVDS